MPQHTGSDPQAMDKPSPDLPHGTKEGRLDSWKKIAVYLKRDITTVQRWEKREGMPVHRHLHDKMGSVYAFQSELDAWMHARSGQVSAPEPDVNDAAALRASRSSIFRARWAAVAGAAVLAAAAAVLLIWFDRSD